MPTAEVARSHVAAVVVLRTSKVSRHGGKTEKNVNEQQTSNEATDVENREPSRVGLTGLLGLSADKLFSLAEELGRLQIFGAWEQDGESAWLRREPNRRPEDSRVTLWHEAESDREPGWYFRFGFGVLCIAGVNSTKPFATADEAKRCMDADLATIKNVIVVSPFV